MYRTTLSGAVVALIALFAVASAAEAQRPTSVPQPPYEGEVSAKRVRIRAGYNVNYTILTVAERGDRVSVRDRRFEWLAIRVPESCTVWVHKDLLRREADAKTATVIKHKVNIRARAEPRADILGQLPVGATVRVLDEDGEWLGIAPPVQATAWVHGKFVRRATQAPAKKPGMDAQAGEAALKEARKRYSAEFAKAPKDRDFAAVLAAYQKVAAKCADAALARRAERARQRLLKIMDLHKTLRSAEEPLEQFEKRFGPLDADFKRRGGAGKGGEPE